MHDDSTTQPIQLVQQIADAHQRNKVIRALYHRCDTLKAHGKYREASEIEYRIHGILADASREALRQMRDEAYEQRRQLEESYRQRVREIEDTARARLDRLYEIARQAARDER